MTKASSLTSPSTSIRASLKRRLPKYIRKALSDYTGFAEQTPAEDPKAFSAHQAACKSALQHLDGALKLLAWAENEGAMDERNSPEDTDALIKLAETTLEGMGNGDGVEVEDLAG